MTFLYRFSGDIILDTTGKKGQEILEEYRFTIYPENNKI